MKVGAGRLLSAAGAFFHLVVISVEGKAERAVFLEKHKPVVERIAAFHVGTDWADAKPDVLVRIAVTFRHTPDDGDDFTAAFGRHVFEATLESRGRKCPHLISSRVPFLRAFATSLCMDALKASVSSRVRPYSRRAYS